LASPHQERAIAADDVFFDVEDGRRLAVALPNARLEIIDGARTFSMIDQPDRHWWTQTVNS
jgi:pimeloyl-ACP methyl ester carboxylesterase